ncbi:uncharacterized protein N7511_006959 [Penicillium nucicola]|uniref:uncharacterized protein n=1 Tax=Penicillium nucicola TaxID=1850975 RepID=UPI00254510BB|nr:uncharacterized protein N7511_006959 [Penicillium nucicola]KAJ5758265.1 hypothetical protein N7511_006959 [Penicillium nucicola]
MSSTRRIKSDPLGVVDTRLTDSHLFSSSFTPAADTRVTSESRYLFASDLVPPTVRTPVTTDAPPNPLSPSFATFSASGLDGPTDMTTQQTSLKKKRGFRELQEASLGLGLRQSFPRLVLDAAADKYVLDNIGDPSNLHESLAPNGVNNSIHEPVLPQATPQVTENLFLRDMPNTKEFNYDCFKDSPEADSPRGRSMYRECDKSQSPTPQKDKRNPLKPPIAALANHHPAPNVSSLKRSGNRVPVPRSVHFSPPRPQIPSLAAQRPLPSVDGTLSSQQKHPGKWKGIRRVTPHRITSPRSPMNMASDQTFQLRDHARVHPPSPPGLPNATHVEHPRNTSGTLATNEPKGVRETQKVPRAMGVLFGIYRPRKPPRGSAPKYVFVAIASQTSEPDGKMPRFAPKFEQIAFQPPLDEVLCQFCIIIPAILTTIPVGLSFYALQYVGNTRIGAVILNFIKTLFSAFFSVFIRAMKSRGLGVVTRANVDFLPNNSS